MQLGRVCHSGFSEEAWNLVRHAQLALPKEIPNLAVAAALDLNLNDGIHLDAPSLARLGRRMARLALGLVERNWAQADVPRISGVAAHINDREMGETDLAFTGVTGGFHPDRGMHGFVLLKADGRPHPSNLVCTAFPHPRQSSVIVVRTFTIPQPGDQIAYGHGLFPICNVVDDADMSLPAFVTTID